MGAQSRQGQKGRAGPASGVCAVQAAANLWEKARGAVAGEGAGSLKITAIDWTCGGLVPRADLEIQAHGIQA